MDFIKKIDWQLVITMLLVSLLAMYLYDRFIADTVTEAKAKEVAEAK